jgi:hypothetical protein
MKQLRIEELKIELKTYTLDLKQARGDQDAANYASVIRNFYFLVNSMM